MKPISILEIHFQAVIASKRKLLRLPGRVNDKEGAWSDLLDHWEEIGSNRGDLCGDEVLDKIVLSLETSGGKQPVEEWAG